LNTTVIDARTGLVHGLDSAGSIATSLDAGINKVTQIDNASTRTIAAQVQHNNFDAIHEAMKARPNSLGGEFKHVTDFDGMTFWYVVC